MSTANDRPLVGQQPDSQKLVSQTPVLRVANLAKSYDLPSSLLSRLTRGGEKASLRALDGIELQLHKGEILALVGESGSGKSTLAKILVGSTAATAGEIAAGELLVPV